MIINNENAPLEIMFIFIINCQYYKYAGKPLVAHFFYHFAFLILIVCKHNLMYL